MSHPRRSKRCATSPAPASSSSARWRSTRCASRRTLEDANLKITGIVTDLLGPSGRAILRALIAGESDPDRLLAHTTGRLRAPRARLLAGLHGTVTAHHRFLLHLHLEQIQALERAIAQLEARVAELIAPLREPVARLTTIPGVSHLVAHVLVAEVGLDMSRFPSPAHLRSWAGSVRASMRAPANGARRACGPGRSSRKGGGLVDAPGRGLVGANTENPH